MAVGSRLLLATGNEHKVEEIKALFARSGLQGIEVRSLAHFPGLGPIAETGTTFKANALIKARTAHEYTGWPALADDSGLEVDALDGRPGVYSARFAGPAASDDANINKLLKLLKGIPVSRRTARFRCIIAVVFGTTDECTFSGTVEGRITGQRRGQNGFGYDPVFYANELGETFGQASLEVKQEVSHRARALEAALPQLKTWFEQ